MPKVLIETSEGIKLGSIKLSDEPVTPAILEDDLIRISKLLLIAYRIERMGDACSIKQ